MPIEILPAGLPDWVQFDSTEDIGFLAEDPHWQTKVGSSNPDEAILYRGNNEDPNFSYLEKSEDGGKSWSVINLPDKNQWYSGATFTHMNPPGYGLTYEPTPKIDPSLSRPHVNFLTYHAYAGNPAHVGEHAVLCSHNYPDGVDTGWDLNTMWVVYTFNDWEVVRWQPVLPDMEFWYAGVTEGSSTQIATGISVDTDAFTLAKISATKIAAFSWSGSTVRAYHLTPNATLTLDNWTSQGSTFADVNAFVYGNSVFFGEIVKITDGYSPGVDSWRARVHEWSFTSTTPVFVGTTESSNLPQYETPFDPLKDKGFGKTWIMTPAGRLAFVYTMEYDIKITGDTNERQVWLFYFDCGTDTYSDPYLYMEGTGLTGIPGHSINMWFNGAVYDGGNGAIVCETYSVTWTNRAKWDWYGRLYMIDIGGWYKYDEVELFVDLDSIWGSSAYVTYIKDSKLLDHTRFAFHYDRGGVRLASYDPAYHRINAVYAKPAFDLGDGGAPRRMMQEDPVTEQVFISGYGAGDTKSAMFWSKWSVNKPVYPRDPYAGVLDSGDDFRHKVAFWSDENTPTMHIAFGSHDKYARIWRTGTSPYDVHVSITTVGTRPVTDKIYSRFYLGKMAFTNNGERLYFGTGDIDAAGTAIDTWLEYLTRNPSSPDYSTFEILGYDNNFGYGWRSTPNSWGDTDVGVSFTDFFNGESYFNLAAWPVEDDGFIMYGLMMYALVPTSPDQIWIYSAATNWDVIWDDGHAPGYVDPVRALVYYNSLIYAAIKTSTGIELYVSDAPPYGTAGDYMNHLSDSFLDDCGIGCMDYDPVDGTLVIGQKVANLLMVGATPPPYTVWYNLTLSHRNDFGLTGLVVL